MTFGEVMQAAAWLMLLCSIVYAHLNYRKLKRVIFNDLKHRFSVTSDAERETKHKVKGCQ